MIDYIKRKDVVDWISKVETLMPKCVLEEIINKIPSVDVVEVVRCKDCKYGHLRENTTRNSSIYCDFGIGVHKENYCSYGERADT